MQTITATGRLSSRNPNFQNMPRGNTFAIRQVVESRFENGKILEGDYSQLEFRVAGFLSNDAQAYADVVDKLDVHSYTANIIGCTRQEAKAHTFNMRFLTHNGHDGVQPQTELLFVTILFKDLQQQTYCPLRWLSYII
jgi:hypothetical protein